MRSGRSRNAFCGGQKRPGPASQLALSWREACKAFALQKSTRLHMCPKAG
jgi:hypothetical protein